MSLTLKTAVTAAAGATAAGGGMWLLSRPDHAQNEPIKWAGLALTLGGALVVPGLAFRQSLRALGNGASLARAFAMFAVPSLAAEAAVIGASQLWTPPRNGSVKDIARRLHETGAPQLGVAPMPKDEADRFTRRFDVAGSGPDGQLIGSEVTQLETALKSMGAAQAGPAVSKQSAEQFNRSARVWTRR